MKEYQAVIIRLLGRNHEDEVAVTDLLNERARGHWTLCATQSLGPRRLLVVFARDAA